MASVLFSGKIVTIRKEEESIDQHIKRHKEDVAIQDSIILERYKAEQKAIKSI